MLVRITEQDKSYVAGLRQMLIDQGAKATTAEEVLEVPDDFDHDQFHGLAPVTSTQPFHVEFADVVAWLKQYTGNFHFYLSLKSQLAFKGSLSPKQVASVRRAIEKEKGVDQSVVKTIASVNPVKVNYSLHPGDVINVSKWLAREVGQKAGLVRPHYTLEVVTVEAETDRAYKAVLRLSGQRMGRCGICGATLTDPKSIVAGIGPICAEKVGVSFTDRSLQELEETLKDTQNVNTWFPKSAVKEKISAKAA